MRMPPSSGESENCTQKAAFKLCLHKNPSGQQRHSNQSQNIIKIQEYIFNQGDLAIFNLGLDFHKANP